MKGIVKYLVDCYDSIMVLTFFYFSPSYYPWLEYTVLWTVSVENWSNYDTMKY